MLQVGAGVGEDEFWQKGNQEIGQGEEEDRRKGTGGQAGSGEGEATLPSSLAVCSTSS